MTSRATSLQDALYAFSIAKQSPDAELLDEFVRRYPEYAGDLTDFAIELAIDAARGDDETAAAVAEPAVSPTVSRAMSRFQNGLFAVQRAAEPLTTPKPSGGARPDNPFLELDRTQFRELAARLQANTLFVGKLRDRHIRRDTMTEGFVQRVADEVPVSVAALNAHFEAQPEIHSGQRFKSDQKPEAGSQQTFEEAVRGSGLTEDQQRFLLSL